MQLTYHHDNCLPLLDRLQAMNLPVGEVLRLFACPNELHNGVEELVTFVFLLLLEHKHEVLAKA